VPTYDYLCTVCGHREETVHGIHGQGPTTCPICGGPMRKAVAAPAVHFKGSGWAKKDRSAAIATRAAAKADAGGDSSKDASSKGADGGTPVSDKTSDKASDKTSDKAPSKTSTASTSSDHPVNRPSSSAPAEAD
jgi:putative FmdB family regulatory protein